MTGRQKHKGNKRPRSWHHRGDGPDRAFARAQRKIEKALREAGQVVDKDAGREVKASVLARELGMSVSDLLFRADRLIQSADDPAGMSTTIYRAGRESEVRLTPRLAAALRASI